MRVSELSRETSVAPHVIRYYSRIGLLGPSRDPRNRYRVFSRSDIQRLKFIRTAKCLGFTLEDIQAILDDADMGCEPRLEVRRIISRRERQTRGRLQRLTRITSRFEAAVAELEADTGFPRGQQRLRQFIHSVAQMNSDLT